MPRITSQKIKIDDQLFTYEIYVNVEGQFTTTLPTEMAQLFIDAKMELKLNRKGRPGYFQSDTLEDLNKEIKNLISEYKSAEIIEDKIVICYIIQTTCTYVLEEDGEILPNGYWRKSRGYSQGCKWEEGTITQHARSPHPFGIQVFARPYLKKVNKFKSGKIVPEHELIHANTPEIEENHFLYKLASFASMSAPTNEEMKEIDYTEDVAEFFCEMLISICKLNERIKNKLEPDKILKIIAGKQKLLT